MPDNTQEYRITDHLASVRATLDGTGAITHTYDYKPFGSLFQGGPEARQSFNSREKDQEAGLFNNGVRKLEDDDGRFTSIDPLWEKFPAWSPYQYGYNNPMSVVDPSGKQGVHIYITPAAVFSPGEGAGDAGKTLTAEDQKAAKLAKLRENFQEAAELSAADYADGTQSHPGMEAWKAAAGAGVVKAAKSSTGSTSAEPSTPSGSATAKSSTGSTKTSTSSSTSTVANVHTAAKNLGYRKTNYRSHGQPVYYNGKNYITPDVDGHNGGAWKMAKTVKDLGSKKTRMGTYDGNLNRIGD